MVSEKKIIEGKVNCKFSDISFQMQVQVKTEKQKMLLGELYDPLDMQLCEERLQARLLIKKLNETGEDRAEEREQILKALLPNTGEGTWIQPPFYCDYGSNMVMGDKVCFNFNSVVLDVMKVTIGSRSLIGPNVQIYTATHPLNYRERAVGVKYTKPVSIGEDVWIGGSTVICPGVSIGDGSIIGADSIVTKNIPENVFAAGNPCRVIRELEKK